MALESRSENSRHISVDPQYNNNRPKEKKSADSKRKDRKGDDNDNKRAEPLWHVILLNLIPFLVATGVYFLAYSILPGKGYLYIFYSFVISIVALSVLRGIMTGIPIKRDLSLYVIFLVVLLAMFMAVNYEYKMKIQTTLNQPAEVAPAPIPVYGPGSYKIIVPAHDSKIFRIKNHCHFHIDGSDNKYLTEIRGKVYSLNWLSEPATLPSVDRNTNIKLIARDNKELFTITVW